jgi:hypothetical protein
MKPRLISAAMAFAALVQGQEPRPAFDTASVKLAVGGPASGGYRHQITPGGITMLHVSLGYCIRIAWSLRYSYELIGPGWLDPPTDVLVDITARTAEPTTEDRVKLMLQTLLTERFHLVAQTETRQLPSYSLVSIRKDQALRPSDGNSEPKMKPGSKPHSQAFQNISMAQLALYLSPPLTSRPVFDKTGRARPRPEAGPRTVPGAGDQPRRKDNGWELTGQTARLPRPRPQKLNFAVATITRPLTIAPCPEP